MSAINNQFAIERREEILAMVDSQGKITMSELSRRFGVSGETLRKDLLELEAKGLLIRTHGGALSRLKRRLAEPLDKRKTSFTTQKKELAAAAVQCLNDGDTVFIDAGSTSTQLAQVIAETNLHLTVATHNLDAFMILSPNPNIHLVLCGGDFDVKEHAFYGMLTIDTLAHLYVDKAFLCPSAISLAQGLSSFREEESLTEIQRAVLKQANQIFVLADSGKFETYAFLQICPLNEKMVFITDSELDPKLYEEYRKQNIFIKRGAEMA